MWLKGFQFKSLKYLYSPLTRGLAILLMAHCSENHSGPKKSPNWLKTNFPICLLHHNQMYSDVEIRTKSGDFHQVAFGVMVTITNSWLTRSNRFSLVRFRHQNYLVTFRKRSWFEVQRVGYREGLLRFYSFYLHTWWAEAYSVGCSLQPQC